METHQRNSKRESTLAHGSLRALHSIASTASIRARAVGAISLAAAAVGGASAQVGASYCSPAIPNSTGAPAVITGAGSAAVPDNDLSLVSSGMPPYSIGFFLTSRDQGNTFPVSNSQGRLCLGGSIGRFVGVGQVLTATASGAFALAVDLSAIPTPEGPVAAQPGETWSFQAWYRDSNPGPTSNFSDGLEVQFISGGTPIAGMVPIPPGTFSMGSNFSMNEQPVHQVTIDHTFWMSQHEVTQAEYAALIGGSPSTFSGASRPVETVGWNGANQYCAALTAQQASLGNLPLGYEYRLPTEAEWEYACRAGTTTEFHYGPAVLCSDARFHFISNANPFIKCPNWWATVPVESYSPNAFGLYDMHGNVSEWCLDSPAPYSSAAVTNPFVTGGQLRVARGGNWNAGSDECRSASRETWSLSNANDSVGFRVVLAKPPSPTVSYSEPPLVFTVDPALSSYTVSTTLGPVNSPLSASGHQTLVLRGAPGQAITAGELPINESTYHLPSFGGQSGIWSYGFNQISFEIVTGAFPVTAAGAFTTNADVTISSGFLVMGPFGGSPAFSQLTGIQGSGQMVTGTLSQVGAVITCTLSHDTTFHFSQPFGGSFTLTGTLVAHHTCATPTPYCTATNNSTGGAASIAALGSTRIQDGALDLVSTGLPQHSLGQFLFSATQTFTTGFGGGVGNLCLSGPLRLSNHVLDSGPTGTATLPVPFSGLPHGATFRIGEAWNFQYWFRDSVGPTTTSNTSNGVQVVFCP